MDGYAGQLATMQVSRADEELEREFEAALAESSTLAFRVAFSVLRHREDAEDIAQEALTKAHRCFRQLRHRDRFRAWLVRITWRLAIDRRRSDQRRLTREISHAREQPVTTVPDDAIDSARSAALWRAIDALPERLRVVIVLANVQEHDLEEVATLLRLPIGTVKSRLFSARARLRELLS
jgi:RNA polymerase sigma-70 factor (ECF subfamily)